MKKIFSILLVLATFMIINLAISPVVQAASNQENTAISSSANIVPAKGLDEEDIQSNTPTTTALPKTGLENMSIIAIVVVAVIGIGSFVRAKTIKIN